jgi:hypothetical protein
MFVGDGEGMIAIVASSEATDGVGPDCGAGGWGAMFWGGELTSRGFSGGARTGMISLLGGQGIFQNA